MRMLLGIAGLSMLWLFCGTTNAQPKEPALPKGVPSKMVGHGETLDNARKAAVALAVKEVSKLMILHDPPVRSFVLTEEYVEKHLLVDPGKPGKDLEHEKGEFFKSWILTLRADVEWWNDILRQNAENERSVRAKGREALGTQVILGLTLVLFAGFGYVQLDEYTNRRYTFLLRLAGVAVVAILLAGWWLVFIQPVV